MKYEYWFIEYEGGASKYAWFDANGNPSGRVIRYITGEVAILRSLDKNPRLFAEPYLSAVKLREVEQ